jgi:hypothetical protein
VLRLCRLGALAKTALLLSPAFSWLCSPSRSQTYSVVLKLASRPDMENLQQFLRGRQAEVPHETLHVLDIVLREQATQM